MELDLPEIEIDKAYAAKPEDPARTYVGASIIGDPCDAYLAFSLRGFPNSAPAPRLKRIFRLGHLLEDEVIADLKLAGYRVWERDPLSGRQWSYEEFGGHVRCNMDGHIEDRGDRLCILEVKSMNNKKWTECKKSGVKVSHPKYFHQCQMMMGMSGIHQTMFVPYNKDTSEYHSERLTFDEFIYAHHRVRTERVLKNEAQKLTAKPDDWRCRGCFKRGVCWEGAEVPVACRTCASALATPDGGWFCQTHKRPASEPCADYQVYTPQPKE